VDRDDDKSFGEEGRGKGRFPELTKQMRTMIATSALKKAKANYYAKYDELNEKMLQDYATLGERVAEIQGENAKDARREIARQACLGLADALLKPVENVSEKTVKKASENVLKKASDALKNATKLYWSNVSAFALPLRAYSLFTKKDKSSETENVSKDESSEIEVNTKSVENTNDLMATQSISEWNYRETTTATFDEVSLVCHKCIRSQECETTKNPLFGNKYCKDWAEEVENCTDIQF